MFNSDYAVIKYASIALLLFPSALLAHSGEGILRYVAQDGRDVGDCSNVVRPCKTLSYAVGKLIKGDKILVAAGQYRITDAADLMRMVSAQSPIQGGYNRFDMYMSQSVNDNPTVLYGIPKSYVSQFEQQGFIIKPDIKFLFDPVYREKIASMENLVKQVNQAKADVACEAGSAGIYACENVDLHSHISLSGFSSSPTSANDIWGYQDLNDNREYILIGLNNGVAIVDVTDPENPLEVATISGGDSYWRDIKVLQNYNRDLGRWQAYAYVTADGAPDGVKIIDLTLLPNSVSVLSTITLDRLAHNVYISNLEYSTGVPLNSRNPLMHITGSSATHGIRGYDLSSPASPELRLLAPTALRGYADYVHDSSSFISAPGSCTENSQGCEVFIDFNVDRVRLWNVEDRINPTLISSFAPNTPEYIHSGWPTEDGQYLFVHDELDEYRGVIARTQVEVFDISNLSSPVYAGAWVGPSNVIDHNGYVRGNRYYMSHYESGLVILDITDPVNPQRVGYFDTFPVRESNAFSGAWGVYPFLPSGVIAVADINSGLYLLNNDTLYGEDANDGRGHIEFNQTDLITVRGDVTVLTVERNDGTMDAVSVQYETLYAAADAEDLTLAAGTLEWSDGESGAQTIEITTAAGQQNRNELFLVRLFNPQGGAALGKQNLAKVTLLNNQAGVASFTVPAVSVDEEATTVTVTVSRLLAAEGELSIQYQTVDETATAGQDYNEASGTLTWADQDSADKTIEIVMLDDSAEEGSESFAVELSGDSSLLGSYSHLTISINGSDASTASSTSSSNATTGSSSGGGALGIYFYVLSFVLLAGSLIRKHIVCNPIKLQ